MAYKDIVSNTGIDIPVNKFTYFFDFEYIKHDKLITNINTIEENSLSYSGNKLSHISPNDVYGVGIKNKIRAFLPTGVKKLDIKFKAYFFTEVKVMKLEYSVITPNDQSVVWYAYNLSEYSTITNQWIDVRLEFNTDNINDLGNIMVIYVWNPGHEEVLVDDLKITFYDKTDN